MPIKKDISKIADEYFDSTSDESNTKLNIDQLSSPITDGMVGVIEDNGKDYKQMLEEALLDKYI